MKNVEKFKSRLVKATRLMDRFIVESAKISSHLLAEGRSNEAENITELTARLQEAGTHMDLAVMRLGSH